MKGFMLFFYVVWLYKILLNVELVFLVKCSVFWNSFVEILVFKKINGKLVV